MNYVFRQGAHEIFELFASIMNVRSSFFTLSVNPIYSGSRLPMCHYCRMLRQELGMEATCHDQDISATAQTRKSKEIYSYCCHGGMHEMAVPICCEDQIIGYAIIGQFRDTTQLRSPYADIWEHRFGNTELQTAYESAPAFSETKIESIKKLFRHSIRIIESEYMIVMKDYDLISPLITRIHEQPETPIPVKDAVKLIGRSESSINRLFKTITGLSFKQYQIQTLLKKANDLMSNNPHTPAAQIAAQLGFEDPLYFSRLYKQHTGKTPSDFRKQLPPEQVSG
ncbi:MAG: PocR ligand-binding domain-containing protein [Kiritimatiellales bacterium]